MSALVGMVMAAWSCSGVSDAEQSEELGRCAARIEPLSAEARAAAAQAFQERYGDAWVVEEVDAFAGFVARARLPLAPDDLGDPVMWTREQAVAQAVMFLTEDASLYGLTAAQVEALTVVSAREIPDAAVLGWTIELGGAAPIPGYEALWPGTRNRFRLVVDMARDGQVMAVFNRSDIAPELDICTTPELGPDDPALVREVVGRDMYYADITGQTRYAGRVQQSDITAVELVIDIERSDDEPLTARLAYRIDVQLDLLSWSFFVEPDTGELIHLEQNFWT